MVETVPVLEHNVPVVEYEYLVLSFGRDTDRTTIRRALTDHAEYGRWELERTVTYVGGRTRTWLRRRIIRPRRSLTPAL
jgi:Family of unknown function (DUF5703)